MKTKYRVTAHVTISLSTVVEAKSKKEAREIAEGRECCSLMSPEQMGYSEDEHWCHSGEIDGQPEIQEVEKEE